MWYSVKYRYKPIWHSCDCRPVCLPVNSRISRTWLQSDTGKWHPSIIRLTNFTSRHDITCKGGTIHARVCVVKIIDTCASRFVHRPPTLRSSSLYSDLSRLAWVVSSYTVACAHACIQMRMRWRRLYYAAGAVVNKLLGACAALIYRPPALTMYIDPLSEKSTTA